LRDPTSRRDAVADLRAVELRVTGTTVENGTRLTRLRGSRVTDPETLGVPPLATDPRNLTLSVTVDGDGVVRAYALVFDATLQGDGARLRVRREHRVLDVGETTVRPPDWVATANESVGGR
jgi:hypothetical protein